MTESINEFPPTGAEILAVPMDPDTNDAGACTVRDYLASLVATLWREEEGFSGKRPFGNSSWQTEVYIAMIRACVIAGTLEDDLYIADLDYDAAEALVLSAIRTLGRAE